MCNKPDIKMKFIDRVIEAEMKLNQDTIEGENMNIFRELCRKKSKEAWYFLFKKGYFIVGLPNSIQTKLIKERKELLKLRYKALKRNRLNEFWKYSCIGCYFLPVRKNICFSLWTCKHPETALFKIGLILNYYLKPGDIYMYNPINRAGYKYYSGENLIIYTVRNDMTAIQRNRLKNAWNMKTANKFNIENCWKVIFCLNNEIDWIMKDSKWFYEEIWDCDPDTCKPLNFVIHFMSTWLGENGFKKFKEYCEIRKIPIWIDC